MADLKRLQAALESSKVSEWEIEQTLLLIAEQPREHWSDLKGALGLDGVEVTTSKRSKIRERAFELTL